MQLKIKKYLHDIYLSIISIEEFIGDKKDFNQYLSNKLLRRGVERELEIIGEAVNNILKLDIDFPIEDARRIVNLRNRLIHGYDKIDNIIVWGIISKDIPNLKFQIEKLMK